MITTGQQHVTEQGIANVITDTSLLMNLEQSFKQDAKSHVPPSKSELDELLASYHQGLQEKTKSIAINLTKRSPKHALAWKILGVIYQKENAAEEAEFALKKATELAPKDAEAHYNLANYYYDQQLLKEAQVAYQKAVKLVPSFVQAIFNLACVLKDMGQNAQAEVQFKNGIKLESNHAAMYFNLAEVIVLQNRHKEAVSYYKKAISLNSQDTQSLLRLGVAYLTLSKLEEAAEHLLEVLKLEPDNASAHNALGLVYQTRKQHEVAIQHFKRAIEIRSDYVPPYKNLGLLYKDMGKAQEAEACYIKALQLETPTAETLNNLAVVLMSQGRYPEAETYCKKALDIAPKQGDSWNNLGLILQAKMLSADAEAAFQKALACQPNDVKTLVNYSVTLKVLGKLSQAETCLKKAIKLDAKDVNAYINLGITYLDQSMVDEAIATTQRALEIDPKNLDAYDNLMFAMSYAAPFNAEVVLKVANEYGQIVAEKAHTPYTSWLAEPNAKKLRVGVVSGDLRQHPVGYFLKNAIEHIDTNKIELFAYSTDGREDKTTAELKPYFSDWKSLAGHHDQAAAEIIYQDKLHILLDLSGHTGGNKLPIFAWKPAPVQASWLGYWATTGVQAINYVIADQTGVPEHHQIQFTEQVKYLPDTRLCFTPPSTKIEVAPLPAIRNGHITFGCFQNLSKVNDEVLKLWAEVMRAVPNAKLRWQCKSFGDQEVISALKKRLLQSGIAPERVEFHGKVPRDEYLATHAEVDFILDSFPFTGGTTTCEALWMGVPTLTLAGETLVARQGASLMTAAGLGNWVAESKQAFIDKAQHLCADIQGLAKLRDGLRAQVTASPLFDGAGFAKNLEALLWEMWQINQGVLAKSLKPANPASRPIKQRHTGHDNTKAKAIANIVSATRMSEEDFWKKSALGLSLKKLQSQEDKIAISVAFDNTRGLSEVFNESIQHAGEDDVLVFIHDDVWIDQEHFVDTVLQGLEMFDVIGVAGNKRRQPNQPGWEFVDLDFTWDNKEYLSGRVAHGKQAYGEISDYGPVPASCELMDGVFLAARAQTLHAKQVYFDPQFEFHFYDLDFCRTARQAELRLGTWPVALTHQSGGAFGNEQWKHTYLKYIKKWEKEDSFFKDAVEKTEVHLFELTTVNAIVEKFSAKVLLESETYLSPEIPIFGNASPNPFVAQSCKITHPAVYMAEVKDFKTIGSAAFPIIENKAVQHQYYSVDIWETSEQGLGYAKISKEKNLIGYANLTGSYAYQDKVINLVGNGSSNYAHWLTEFLPQIVLLKNAGVDISEYQILVDQNSFPSMLDALYLIGVKKEQLVMIEQMSLNTFPEALWVSPVANVVFQRPHALHGAGKDILSEPQHAIFHPQALREVRNTYLSCIESDTLSEYPEKIFIKRTPSRSVNLRVMLNEQEIESLLVANGFVSIDPSLITFAQQVALFSRAKYIVSASGAALVNMLWAQEGARVCVLMNDTKYANYWYFSHIAASVGLKLSYVLGSALPSKTCTDLHHADFEIQPDAVIEALNHAGLENLVNPQEALNKALEEVLDLAIEQQNAGNAEEAKQLYHEILKVYPEHAIANHHLGVIETHLDTPMAALPRFLTAVQSAPENEQFWVSYIDALALAGDIEELANVLEVGQQFGLTQAMAESLKEEFNQLLTQQATEKHKKTSTPVATICTLIPAYKPDYIEALLLSLATQTYRQFKVIISDDNPTDEVTKVVNQLYLRGQLKGLSIELVAGPKKGGFANIYHLVRTYAQQAEFFHILMDDDLIYPTFYETHMRAHANTQAELSMSARWNANELGQPYMQCMDAATSEQLSKEFTAKSIAKAMIPSCNNKLGEWSHAVFRSGAAEVILNPSISGINYFGLDDIGSFIHATQTVPGIWIPESLGIFRNNPHQNTGKIENPTIKCAHYSWIALALIALEQNWITESEAWAGICLIKETIRSRYQHDALGQQMLSVLDAYTQYQPAFKDAFLSVWNAYLGEIKITQILQGDLSIKLL